MKFTSRGVIAVCGALALVLGALFLIDSPLPEMRIKPLIVFTVVLPFALITAFLVTVASRARRNKIAGARFPQQSAANLQAMDRQ
jgi:membrane-bound serine protease (ClpP class)